MLRLGLGPQTPRPRASSGGLAQGIDAGQAGNLLITFSNTSATNPNVYAKVSNTEWNYIEEISGEFATFLLFWDINKWILAEGYEGTTAESTAGDINTIPTSGWTYTVLSGPAIVVAEEP